MYLDWASKAPAKRPESLCTTSGLAFTTTRSFVSWLISCAANWTVYSSDAQRAREFFSRAVELEQLFFDESYTHPLP